MTIYNNMKIENSQKIIKYIIFIIIITLLLILKFSLKKLNTGSFQWLLLPTTLLVEIFTGNKFVYIIGKGFISYNEIITINKSCSGINLFILLTFLSLYILFNKKIKTSRQFFLLAPYQFFAYIFTIFANALRISFSILFEPIRLNSPILKSANNWIHQGIGSFIFLISVLIFYFLLMRGKLWIKKIFS